MEQASSALQVIVAALLAAVATTVTALVIGSWDSAVITPVALSTFLGGLLTPFLANALAAKKAQVASRPRKVKASSSSSEEARTLYVGNLPFKTDEETINELFSHYGQVLAVRLVKDRRTGRKKGYGFVEMDANAADAALAKLNDSEFEGRTIKVRAAHSEAEDE